MGISESTVYHITPEGQETPGGLSRGVDSGVENILSGTYSANSQGSGGGSVIAPTSSSPATPSSSSDAVTRKARRKERECTAAQEQEHKLYLEEAVLERKIPETDLRQLVELPPGLGYEEWLASHTIDFFQHLNLLYGTVCEYCTSSGCPDMSGPATRQYLWFDEKGKKTRVAAPQYVDYVMIFTQKTINDESIFPTKFENDFPVSFESIVKKIHRLLFHVLAHLYHSHFREMVLLNLHSHLNCIFAHFILFNERFKLIDEKETEILQDLVVALKLHPESEVSSSTSSSLSATTTITSITTTTSTTTTASTGSKTGVMCSSSDDATVATSNQCLATEFSSCEEKCVVTQPCAGLSDSVTSSSSSNGGAPDTPLVGSGPPLITAGADDTQP
ncbi:MOB kinase activator-like 2 isoform X3 [Oratosquilla oratoria]|uniref:MOB kinase activator-like 2 isoform X3 n=1 Tax=Oratosquilla oratoria TaxID=337810 RepID=UPI003F777274